MPADAVASLFDGFADVELLALDDLQSLDWATLPADGRTTVLASNHRDRYGAPARSWRPDLHLVLWNPFQTLDIAAPALVSWGYADGALEAVHAWLEGHAVATGHSPVRLSIAG